MMHASRPPYTVLQIQESISVSNKCKMRKASYNIIRNEGLNCKCNSWD